MPKLKTHRATSKRIRISRPAKLRKKRAKLLQRTAGQDHFNSREPGKVTKRKRRDHQISQSNVRSIKKLIPYR
ncbi:MAG: 50S ribosomal protein L35 [Candidatus Kerfeldbacteria bacterium CG_4_10_14_0_8_um_filter_42_10]|uniref:Large ribosomal subunit protein bL35 n=1 Tax=Candidatus Kerfeldbacteria bacterium CG_4_10_14_0_8_um_filter_42_10 TaxID=2014248 RepID=A0A2M7RHT5_9BACT|nr:MAG: 50S ribosomal protein L35 [Candidatus Kerfeldbacteria bacterium CG_4_10_14_0_8_um_filter_42_10]